MSRREIENPRDIPALGPAIKEAERLGMAVGAGFTLGNTVVGLNLTGPAGQRFLVEVHAKNWRKGYEPVRQAARTHGIPIPDAADTATTPATPHPLLSKPTP